MLQQSPQTVMEDMIYYNPYKIRFVDFNEDVLLLDTFDKKYHENYNIKPFIILDNNVFGNRGYTCSKILFNYLNGIE